MNNTLTPKDLFKFPNGRVDLDEFALHMIMAKQSDSEFEFAEFYQNGRPNYVTNVIYIGDKDTYRLELTDRVGRVTHRDIPRSEGLWTDGDSFFPGGEFVQKRPQTEWVAVRKEKDKILKAPEFYVYANKEIYEKGFQPTLRAEGENYSILGVNDGPTVSQITVFTARDNSNEVIKWHYEKDAEFEYDWQKDAWEGSPTVRVSTDRKTIRETLNLNGGNAAVFVSGKGLTFYGSWTNSFLDFDVYVFLSGDEKQYFHSTKGTRLRTKKGGGAIEFNLDHVRRIHVD